MTVEYGSRIEGLEQDGELAHVTIQNAVGSENVSVPYVLGSDGASGVVRKLIGI